jgi:isocitrate/isopropylmalate dehydrogenase
MSHKVTLIPGDGIGPEVTQATVRVLEATGVKFEWESFAVGADAFEKHGEYIPKEALESIERTSVALKGPVTTPVGGGFSSINVALRQKFELYANFARSGICHISRRVIPMSISLSCARIPKVCTLVWSMRSSPAWWKA